MEFNRARVKEMIQRQTAKYDWQFLFLGANMDAVSEPQLLLRILDREHPSRFVIDF